ncbi:Dps family protein [Frondihabitans sp. VKM Ac-2883]|uniref:Dps family protein n=1 Tax=Frondihabitans sp. VKM Ac-2883 TaxID=2783823 RepID=UPI00188A8A1C|nr:DNA starvation/stationary phase protection protein [Frondihabitans sp. VKM Ac-2883]MBF4576699.1 DNA starvation/stationary phase protection protein [Frondihabitans sp. VKM Ac-2883]
MSEVTTVTQSSVDPDVAAATAQFLSPIVTNLTALAVNGKQAHWHVRGISFIAVHELLDVVVGNAQEYADLAAERIVALGLPVDGRLETVAATTTNPPLRAGFQQIDATIAGIVAQIDSARVSVQTAIDELGEIDASSQDVAIEIARGLDKDRWFLSAHVSQ